MTSPNENEPQNPFPPSGAMVRHSKTGAIGTISFYTKTTKTGIWPFNKMNVQLMVRVLVGFGLYSEFTKEAFNELLDSKEIRFISAQNGIS